MKTVLKTTKAALEALDFTEENARYAETQRELASFTEAQDKIRQRIVAIDEEVREGRDKLKEGEAAWAADAILAGADIREIAAGPNTTRDLLDERASLLATQKNLRHREEDLRPALTALEGKCRQRAAVAAQPMAEAILAQAVEAGKHLVNAYATLGALEATTRSHCKGQSELADVIDALQGLFQATDSYPTATICEDVRAALLPLGAKGPAARMATPSIVNGSPNVRAWQEVGHKLQGNRIMAIQAAQTRMAARPH